MRWIRSALVASIAGLGCNFLDEPRLPASARAEAAPGARPAAAPPPVAARVAGHAVPVRSPDPLERTAPLRELTRVSTDELCVTRGKLADRAIEDPTFRAVAQTGTGDEAAMRFVVRGSTAKARALASGQERRQLGLKLRAQDGCNLVYVMWRLDPRPKLDISVKANAGKRTAKECGAHGYKKVKPTRSVPVPSLEPGSEHELRAEIRGDELIASIDGNVVWQGRLPATARDLMGPAGIRSDNLAYELLGLEVDGEATRDVTAKCVGVESD